MASARYAIPDEPSPGRMERYIVDPMWPMFAQMLGGSWLALPWFVFNGFALGSPTRVREAVLAAASLVGSAMLVFALFAAAGRFDLDRTTARLLMLPLLVLKLGIAYALYLYQSRSFELWRHFGGRPANGIAIVAVSVFAEAALFRALPAWLPLQLVLE